MKRNKKIYIYTFITLILIFFASFLFTESAEIKEVITTSKCEKFSPKISSKDGERIEEIISTMANTSTLGLAFKSKHLRRLGDEVDKKVPPLEFLAYIFSHPQLAEYMARIQTSGFKYNGFVEGLQGNLMKLHKQGCLEEQGKEFAKYLNLDAKKIVSLLQKGAEKAIKNNDKRAFKDLVTYLITEKSKSSHN